jgi:cytochrome c556
MGLVAGGRKEYKPEEFLVMAQDLHTLSSKPWVYFPADGNYPPTHARPAVWSQPAAFKAAQDKYQASVQALLVAAQAGKLEPVQQAMEAVTASCKSCHKEFRYE